MSGITLDQLLTAWREVAAANDDEGLSVRELCKLWSPISSKRVMQLLQHQQDEGNLIVGRRHERRIDGVGCIIPVYRLKEES